MNIRWAKIGQFYGIALAGISALAALMYVGREQLGPAATALTALAMFSPLVATLAMNKLDGKSLFDGLGTYRFSRYLIAALVVPVGIAMGALATGAMLPGVQLDLGMSAMLAALPPDQAEAARAQLASVRGGTIGLLVLGSLAAMVSGATLNSVFAFGEEVGWRGWLQRELEPLGFWGSSVVIGLMWGFWHAPIIALGHNYPVHRLEGIFLFPVVCVLLSPWLSWVRNRADSVWAAAIFHGTFNGIASLPMLLVTGPELIIGVQGLAGVLTLLGFNVGLAIVMQLEGPQVAGEGSQD